MEKATKFRHFKGYRYNGSRGRCNSASFYNENKILSSTFLLLILVARCPVYSGFSSPHLKGWDPLIVITVIDKGKHRC